MSHIHVRRWQRPRSDEYDDAPGNPGMMGGSVADLTQYEDEPSELVFADGRPIPRPVPARRPFGFVPRDRA